MISFESDYNNGAHPKVLEALVKTNEEQTLSYGYDRFSEEARKKIRTACKAPDAKIWFLAGGTQTNATVIDSIIHDVEGVVCVDTGHINVHEAGAVEFTGHKVITLPGHDGKMRASDLDDYMSTFLVDENAPHCVCPGMVYITFPNELGILYKADEIADIYKVCQKYNLPLYIDGARLGYGLMSPDNDIDMPFLASHCDVFYIGGTKVGALCGEAVVFPRGNAHPRFFSITKQHGGLMAKGRLIGVQFNALFTDNLYLNISKHAIDMAMRMKQIFKSAGYELYIDSPTNQQFVILKDDEVKRLSSDFLFSNWGKYGEDQSIYRFVTSWATKESEIDALEAACLQK